MRSSTSRRHADSRIHDAELNFNPSGFALPLATTKVGSVPASVNLIALLIRLIRILQTWGRPGGDAAFPGRRESLK